MKIHEHLDGGGKTVTITTGPECFYTGPSGCSGPLMSRNEAAQFIKANSYRRLKTYKYDGNMVR